MSHALTLGVFAVLVVAMLGIIVWAGRRTRTASDFWAAGRGISAPQNGLAVAGDFMSAGTFLGTVGLIFLSGFDGTLILVAALFSFLPLLFLLAERLRNAGAYTLADVLALRFHTGSMRSAAAVTTIVVSLFYLFAQMVGAGTILTALSGLSYPVAVLVTGLFMTVYVVLGGMLGATWVMIVKALLLVVTGVALTLAVLANAGWSLGHLLELAQAQVPAKDILGPGLLLPHGTTLSRLDIVSYGLVYMLGTAGLPHVLIRFFTVRDGNAARRSLGWAIGVMGFFFLLVVAIGFGARALLHGDAATDAAKAGGNLVAPILARELGGGVGSAGGAIALALVSGIAFLTILAVVSGLLISASGAAAHDLWTGVFRRGSQKAQAQEPKVARITAVLIGAVATVISIAIGSGVNVTFLLGLAFLVAASANLPVILLTLFWKRFTRAGAVVGLYGGLVCSIVVIVLSPTMLDEPVISLKYPAIISIPLGFLCCLLGTLFGRRDADRQADFEEMTVRTELGGGVLGDRDEPATVPAGH